MVVQLIWMAALAQGTVTCIPAGSSLNVLTSECVNSTTGEWSSFTPLKQHRSLFVLAYLNGRPCLVAGSVGSGTSSSTTVSPTECLDKDSTGTWKWNTAPYLLPTLRSTLAAAVVTDRNGLTCVTGGLQQGQVLVMNLVDCFDPTIDDFVRSPTLTLATSRAYHTPFPIQSADPAAPVTWCVGGGMTTTASESNTVECINYINRFAQFGQLAWVDRRSSAATIYIDGLLCIAGGNPVDPINPYRSIECLNTARLAANMKANPPPATMAAGITLDPTIRWTKSTLLLNVGRIAPSSLTIKGRSCLAGGTDERTVECYQGGGVMPEVVNNQLVFGGKFVYANPMSVYRSWTVPIDLPGTTPVITYATSWPV